MSALSDLLSGLDTVGKSLAGSKSTVTSQTTVDPAATAAFDQIQNQIAGLTSKGATEADINTLLAPLLDHVKQTILPLVGKQQSSGMYSSTPVEGMALAEGTKAVNQALSDALKSRDNLLQTAMYGAKGRLDAMKSTTAITRQAGNPLLQALGIGTAGLGAAQKLGLVGADPLGIGEMLAPLKAKIAAKKAQAAIEGIGAEDEAVRSSISADQAATDAAEASGAGATDASLGAAGTANAEASTIAAGVGAGATTDAAGALVDTSGALEVLSGGAEAVSGDAAMAAFLGGGEAAGGFELADLIGALAFL